MKIGTVLFVILFSTGAFARAGLELEEAIHKVKNSAMDTKDNTTDLWTAWINYGRQVQKEKKETESKIDNLKKKLRECENNQSDSQSNQQY